MDKEHVEEIKEIVRRYENIGQIIIRETEKLKNKLDPETGLEVHDLEAIAEQLPVWVRSMGKIGDRIDALLKVSGKSI